MKNKTSLRHIALLSGILFPTSLQALEVHEWGTFTILNSSAGSAVEWYQPLSDISQLPAFTMNPMMMKQNIIHARVRMETPVIYFYPEEEMTVHARVMFRNGSITERFPSESPTPYRGGMTGMNVVHLAALNQLNVGCSVRPPTKDQLFDQRVEEFTSTHRPIVTYWTGNLLPPDHKDAKLIPKVSGKAGEHYAAARAVPDAWLFRSHSTNAFMTTPNTPQVEKFIFYRGAGQETPPYHASMPNENTVTLRSHSQSPSTFIVALRVRDGRASWKQMPNIAGPAPEIDRSSTMEFPEETVPVAQADQELSALFVRELIDQGLTKAEAEAMIATWNHTWFTEPGQRIFTIVDRTWVDAVLPLAIAPEPKKMERVFVARYELLSPHTEKTLARLLEEPASKERTQEFASLQLGRFSRGASTVVAEQKMAASLQQFNALYYEQQAAEKAEANAAKP